VYSELANLTSAQVMEKTENIYNTAMDIFTLSDAQNITTHQAALNIAQKRIDDRKKELQNK
jgi:leucine dehydrogenase